MNPKRRPSNRLLWVAAQLVLGGVALVAFAANGNPWFGVACLAAMSASVVAFEIAHRRGAPIAGLLTGVGDERARSLYREANSRTGELLAYVLGVWAIIAVATGKQNDTLLAIVCVYAGLWTVNVLRSVVASRPARGGASV